MSKEYTCDCKLRSVADISEAIYLIESLKIVLAIHIIYSVPVHVLEFEGSTVFELIGVLNHYILC